MKFFTLVIFVALFLAVNFAQAQKNLVTNGGFEDDDLYGWNQNGAKQTPWDFKSGKNSCVIITQNTDNWVGLDQTVTIPKKAKVIEFSAWIKTRNVIKGKNDWDGAVFTIVFLNAGDKQIRDGINIARVTGDQEWTLSKDTIEIPEKAASFKILLAMGNASGSMLVDDVSAVVVAFQPIVK